MKRKSTETKKFKTLLVNLPEELIDKLDQHFLNPITGKAVYGRKSQLVTKLLNNYFHHVELAKENAQKLIDENKEKNQ